MGVAIIITVNIYMQIKVNVLFIMSYAKYNSSFIHAGGLSQQNFTFIY